MNDIIILVKEINLRLTATIDFNGSMLVEKIITQREGPPKFRKWIKTELCDRDGIEKKFYSGSQN